MTGQESKRLDLYNRLQEVLGTDPATTLMTYLPPVETPELLTRTEFKTEIAAFRELTQAKFDRIDSRFDELNNRIDRVLLSVVAGMFVILAAIIGTGILG